MKGMILFLFLLFSFVGHAATELRLFWLSSCPHCHEQLKDVERLQASYPELKVFTYQLDENQTYIEELRKLSEIYQFQFGSVPVSFVGNRVWVGFSKQIGIEIENRIKDCLSKHLDCKVNSGTRQVKDKFKIQIPFIGDYDLTHSSLISSTILIALVDGFNPCSLWVLSLLMTMIVGTKSRKRILVIGLSFLLTTALVYGFFMAGIVSSLQYLNHLTWIKIGVALLALIFALVNIKDYFWYKKGISFTIPDRFRPVIYRNLRKITHSNQSVFFLIGFTFLIAGGIALVEFPCTAGFPVIWGQLILYYEVAGTQFVSLLLLYILFYLLDELLIFIVIVVTLNISQLQEKHGRFLKLVSGMVMLFLALTLVLAPHIMENMVTSFALVLIAVVISIIIHKVYQSPTSPSPK
jgi:hypothetical protein